MLISLRWNIISPKTILNSAYSATPALRFCDLSVELNLKQKSRNYCNIISVEDHKKIIENLCTNLF